MNTKGCSFIDAGINFEDDKVCDCCISHNDGRGLPLLIDNYNGEPIDWENLFEIKAKRIAAQKIKTIYECENCYHLTDYEFKQDKKISEFHFSHCRSCNAKCVYCSDKQGNHGVRYDVLPVIKDLIEKGYYKSGGEATMQGGEPTLMIHFEELIDLLASNGTSLRIHSSGIKFSPSIEKTLKNNVGKLVVSIDSSSRSTYLKIKQVDCFDLVCENIKKYALAAENSQNLIIKYIIIPRYNDNPAEIKSFFDLMKSLGVETVALDIECNYARKYNNENLSPHIYFLIDYFKYLVGKYNFDLKSYSFLSYVLQKRTVPTVTLFQDFHKFEKFLQGYVQADKNLDYKR